MLFERLIVEINQAGLLWITILKKADNVRLSYGNFDVDIAAVYEQEDRARLLNDAGVIRNRLKVNTAIENARRIQALRTEYGCFQGWLVADHLQTVENWAKLFKRTFVITGERISMYF